MTPIGRAAPGIDQYSPSNIDGMLSDGPTQRQGGIDQNIYAGMNNSQMT